MTEDSSIGPTEPVLLECFNQGMRGGLLMAQDLLMKAVGQCVYTDDLPVEGPAHAKLLLTLGEVMGRISKAITEETVQ